MPRRNLPTPQDELPPLGAELLRRVRSQLVLRGSSLAAVARDLEVDPRNLAKTLLGHWRGPRATRLRDAALTAAGLDPAGLPTAEEPKHAAA
jgi:hypothetical protein